MELLQRFEHFYSDFKAADLTRLDEFYAPAVRFRDPIQEVVGTERLRNYFAASRRKVEECRFEFLNHLNDEDQCFYQWCMHYSHPQLAGGRLLHLNGMSHIHIAGDRIVSHTDIYDMGAMLYEQVPVLGVGVRWLKQRLQEK